jgi:hypothetical protein
MSLQEFTPKNDAIRTLTSDFANWYLALPNLPGERPLDADHVEDIVRKMDAKVFMGEQVNVATIEFGGKTYKGNGQHTCTARLRYNGTHDYKVRHLHYVVPHKSAASKLYRQFDPSFSGRSYAHLMRQASESNGVYAVVGSARVVILFAAAAAFHKGGKTVFGKSQVDRDFKIEAPLRDKAGLAFLANCLGARNQARHMWREAIACAIDQTRRIDPAFAETFWHKVRDGDGLRAGSPELRIRNWLMQSSAKNGGGASKARPAGFHEMYSRCIHAWNAAREGRTTDLKYYANADLPIPR